MSDKRVNGAIVRRLRESRGWTQGQLAQRSGVKQSHISMIENGDVLDMTVARAIRLARALGVTVEDLTAPEEGLPATSDNLDDPEVKLALAALAVLGPRDRRMISRMILDFKRSIDEEEERQRKESDLI